MGFKIYNTASREVEIFKPLKEGLVTMYACGPTVYDKTHIGHMRKYTGDDILKRSLTFLGYKVKHVMNITDVGHLTNDSDHGDDKFHTKAQLEGKTVWEIADFYTNYFHETMQSIGVSAPSIESKATTHIEEIKALVTNLLEKGFAYETKSAIYFDISKDKDYGKLSGQKLSDKEIGVRDDVIVDPEKRNPADFSLWFKRVGRFENHAMYWASPWGDGFPGWHIECSAMAMHYLGETIDIHTGGIDHIPVHHENEIAQSECATGHQFVNYWVHYDFLMVDGEKMSKSKNNFYTIEDIVARDINPLATRLLFMQTSYRKPINFTWEALESADKMLQKITRFASKQMFVGDVVPKYIDEFKNALCDDLNTSVASATLWEMMGDESIEDKDKWATLLQFDRVLGLGLDMVSKFEITPEAQALVIKRDEARLKKDFALSDQLRNELQNLGYEVLDTPNGTELN